MKLLLQYRIIKYLLHITICSYLLSSSTLQAATESFIKNDPHRVSSGFFDIHICNWPDRPPFYLALFGTEQYNDITLIEIFAPDNSKVGELDLNIFTTNKSKNKAERRVFLTQLKIPDKAVDGWYSAKIHFTNKPSQTAQDFLIHTVMARVKNHVPENDTEVLSTPKRLSWEKIEGATHYKVFIKDMWGGEKVIHTSAMLTSNSFNVPEGILKPGGYYAWRVHARDVNEHILLGDFNMGSLSEWVEFSISD